MPQPQLSPMWVGQVERRAPDLGELSVAPHYGIARLLVAADGVPVGLAAVDLVDGRASSTSVLDAIRDQIGRDGPVVIPPMSNEPLTVVVATRNRAESLRRCVRAILRSRHPAVTVIVVDNDPVDDASARAVAELADQRIRYVREPRRGVSVGRNRGLDEARTRVVAFTDDDTEVDPLWAGRISGLFASEPDLACVSGPVVGARLDTHEERAAEFGLVWNKGFVGRRFSLAAPPPGSPIFPFAPGLYGIGANFAVRADSARAAGGFDDALGPGTGSRAGEDGEFMVRLVLAGRVVGYEPGLVVWHHHRNTADGLSIQQQGYASGLGAFLTKIMLEPRAFVSAMRRLPAAVAQMRHISRRETAASDALPSLPAGRRAKLMISGGLVYARDRRAVRRSGGRVPSLLARHGRLQEGPAPRSLQRTPGP